MGDHKETFLAGEMVVGGTVRRISILDSATMSLNAMDGRVITPSQEK